MQVPQSLQTIAEISIAFAGFSGLIVALRKNTGPLTEVEKYRLQILLTLAFGAMFTLSPYKVQDTFPDGSTKIIRRDAGELVWGDELTHATENIGETAVHALIIELKTQ